VKRGLPRLRQLLDTQTWVPSQSESEQHISTRGSHSSGGAISGGGVDDADEGGSGVISGVGRSCPGEVVPFDVSGVGGVLDGLDVAGIGAVGGFVGAVCGVEMVGTGSLLVGTDVDTGESVPFEDFLLLFPFSALFVRFPFFLLSDLTDFVVDSVAFGFFNSFGFFDILRSVVDWSSSAAIGGLHVFIFGISFRAEAASGNASG
jgi:hypothetical protein